jgi:hypothetical protein
MPPIRRLGLLLLAATLVLGGCAASQAPSFDPTGACSGDGRAPGAYPELEAMVPIAFYDAAPDTLDSGRNCTAANLGSLAARGISEVRFAGGTWTFGAERAAVLAVFRADGLDAAALASFYADGAKANGRTKILDQTMPSIAGRTGYRLDTETSTRAQTVVTWPGTNDDVVNVVLTSDLPDARIQEAIDAFGGR